MEVPQTEAASCYDCQEAAAAVCLSYPPGGLLLVVVVLLQLVLAAAVAVAGPGGAAAVAAIAVHGGQGGACSPPARIQLLSQRRARQDRARGGAQLHNTGATERSSKHRVVGDCMCAGTRTQTVIQCVHNQRRRSTDTPAAHPLPSPDFSRNAQTMSCWQ